ncbi:MAG: sigma-54-dependent transcriptional regulator [Thermodesulfobacteriota bacterium]
MTRRPRILIVEDEELARDNLRYILSKEQYEIEAVGSGSEALESLQRNEYDLVLTDLRMEKVDGMEVLARTKAHRPATEVIMITGYATVDSAIEAMKLGAFHYIAKPYKIEEVRALVRQALEKKRLRDELDELRKDLEARDGLGSIVGKSRAIQELMETVRQIAPTDCNVLIMGETGTGKELVARAIHQLSKRSKAHFLAINCGAFTEELLANELFGHEKEAFTGAHTAKQGLFEAAQGGTIFLDEIGDMPPAMQVRLLRVIQDKAVMRLGGTVSIPVDVRVVAATNKDLKRLVEEGRFRSDLYFRLNVVALHVPPLSQRKEDIPLLAHHFLRKFSSRQGKEIKGITEEMMGLLMNYPFPGNVRELENVIERAVALSKGGMLEAKDLPQEFTLFRFRALRPQSGELPTLEEAERDYIQWVLQYTKWNRTKAAEILGIDRVSLWRKIKQYSLAPPGMAGQEDQENRPL